MQTWEHTESFLLDAAMRDLRGDGQVTPCLVAFRGDGPLLAAFWRPFAKGDYEQPFVELMALASPLGADRLALSMGARAWSLADPVPPVLPEADLRQPVLCIHTADATVTPTARSGALFPYDVAGGAVHWGEPLRDVATGWIPEALAIAAEAADTMLAPLPAIREQARRCVELGHTVYLAPAVADVLEVAGRP
jgi:hypothetical protein